LQVYSLDEKPLLETHQGWLAKFGHIQLQREGILVHDQPYQAPLNRKFR
jgi:hypothetical protein